MKPLLILATALALGGCITVSDKGGGSRFVRSESPSQMGTATITKEIGLQDTAVTFYVLDPKRGAKPIKVGFVGDAGWQGTLPRDAAWSKDGSVVAVQGADYKSWSHAYDFKTGQTLEDLYAPFTGNIAKLLKSRGGVGAKVLADWNSFDAVAQPAPATSVR